jgi:hypothetical protein
MIICSPSLVGLGNPIALFASGVLVLIVVGRRWKG